MIPGLMAHPGEARAINSFLVVNKASDNEFLPSAAIEMPFTESNPEAQ